MDKISEVEYFSGDELAASVWRGKYAMEDEVNPDDMHKRLAKEFARIESSYSDKEYTLLQTVRNPDRLIDSLSDYGIERSSLTQETIYNLFKDFKYIIPQGSIMYGLGRKDKFISLSNCFVISSPLDSYGGIFKAEQEQVQLMKRRGGVGLDISNLRPEGTSVTNSAGTSTGVVSFMERFSNGTREVAQNGRRGALMLSIDVNHPDVEKFATIKSDRTKVTGANISIRLNDEFMEAVKNDTDYVLRFPCDATDWIVDNDIYTKKTLPYNKLVATYCGEAKYIKKVKAKELWNTIVTQAKENAEPGLMFWDNVLDMSPDSVYPEFTPVSSNPCFHPNTLIETEYGKMKIKDINKPMRVYSMDSDGKLIMSNASNAFVSKTNAETLKITLKSGSNITVTPDHKLYVQNIGWFKAEDLKVGNQLGHLCRSRRGAKYAGVHLTTSPNRAKDQVMEHKLVYGSHEIDMNVHHKDRNTYNNSINNLELLSHSEHSKLTATEDNPQTHQVRNETGKFISGKDSKKGKKTTIDLPVELKTNMYSPHHNMIETIEVGEITDVWDIQVENTHCVIANNIIAHNCGEQFLQPYDSCRLMCMNLFSMVKNPFTDTAEVDFDLLYKIAYEQQRLMDDLVDLEIENVEDIICKIESDDQPVEVKATELTLWQNILKAAKAGRRTGSGITALADMLAALNLKYDSDEALKIVELVMSTKMRGELDCTIDLSILRGSFEGFDAIKEGIALNEEGFYKPANSFYFYLRADFYEQSVRMAKYGRRNVSFSTIAPTGSVSILTGTSSGCEPLFMPFYMRRKKVNPSDKDVRVDFVDQNKDSWQEFPVLHSKFKDWLFIHTDTVDADMNLIPKEDLQKWFKESPWYGSTANDINWVKRVEMQSILQKYTTNAISSTLNLPETVTLEEVQDIYMKSYELKLKGVTVYVEGSRTGVLVSNNEKKTDTFEYKDALKRPDSLKVEIYTTVSKGIKWNVIIGLYDGKPYEVFALHHFTDIKNGELLKLKEGRYDLYTNGELYSENITSEMTGEEAIITRLCSTSLRHGSDVTFLVEQLEKTSGDITSFGKALSRTLKKYARTERFTEKAKCPECSGALRYEEGCKKCANGCGYSAC